MEGRGSYLPYRARSTVKVSLLLIIDWNKRDPSGKTDAHSFAMAGRALIITYSTTSAGRKAR